MNPIEEIIQRIEPGAADLIPRQELVGKLERSRTTGKPLRVKLGIDPSAPQLTLGTRYP